MKFLIPSTGRSQFIADLIDLLGKKDVLVYVKENEYKTYLSNNCPEENLVGYSNDIIGMGAIRKYMLEQHLKEDYVFQIDDDVVEFEYKFSERVDRIVDPDHIKAIVENAYNAANDLGTPLFGFLSTVGPMLYTQLNHALFSGTIICGLGIIPKHLGDINFDERLIVNEDQDFTLQTKHYKRFIFMDARYGIVARKIWKLEGGCSTLRNSDTMERCKSILKQKWGTSVVLNRRKPNQVFLYVKF